MRLNNWWGWKNNKRFNNFNNLLLNIIQARFIVYRVRLWSYIVVGSLGSVLWFPCSRKKTAVFLIKVARFQKAKEYKLLKHFKGTNTWDCFGYQCTRTRISSADSLSCSQTIKTSKYNSFKVFQIIVYGLLYKRKVLISFNESWKSLLSYAGCSQCMRACQFVAWHFCCDIYF